MSAAHNALLSLLNPMLDYLAFTHNKPMAIETVAITDLRDNVKVLSFFRPYRQVELGSFRYNPSPSARLAFALYWEGKNSRSAAYQILSYYKIIEGLSEPRGPNCVSAPAD